MLPPILMRRCWIVSFLDRLGVFLYNKRKETEVTEMEVFRNHYRGFIAEGISEEAFSEAAAQAEKEVKEAVRQGRFMTIGLYRHGKMLFLYYEALGTDCTPDEVMAKLAPVLADCPGEFGMRKWIYMQHIYYHSVPEDAEDWKRKTKPERRRGRIAWLKKEKHFSYVYHHTAIVNEGLLKGDKYQSIALNENILFSYFEEPRSHVNIRRVESEDSEAMKEWLAVDPEGHFVREPHGSNFLFIDPVIEFGETDL